MRKLSDEGVRNERLFSGDVFGEDEERMLFGDLPDMNTPTKQKSFEPLEEIKE